MASGKRSKELIQTAVARCHRRTQHPHSTFTFRLADPQFDSSAAVSPLIPTQQSHSIKSILLKPALAFVALCAFAPLALADDQQNIQGTWTLVTATMDNQPMALRGVEYVFEGGSMIVRAPIGQEQKTTFTLDLASKPKVLVIEHGAKPDRTPYELNGDTLKIAFTSSDEAAADFSGKGYVMFTLARKKSQ